MMEIYLCLFSTFIEYHVNYYLFIFLRKPLHFHRINYYLAIFFSHTRVVFSHSPFYFAKSILANFFFFFFFCF